MKWIDLWYLIVVLISCIFQYVPVNSFFEFLNCLSSLVLGFMPDFTPNFHVFFSLLFVTVFYSKQSSMEEFTTDHAKIVLRKVRRENSYSWPGALTDLVSPFETLTVIKESQMG